MTKPLRPGSVTHTSQGDISHSSLIGAHPRDLIPSNAGAKYRATFPTVDEYITKIPRLVTPIYPLDAATITTLLDIHADPRAEAPLEIFEAGTGHGSLTLALSKEIHAANAGLPLPMSEEDKAKRKAVLHTLDRSRKHSEHARWVVEGFRRGMYAGNIDYHVGDPGEWLDAEYAKRGEKEFLYAVILDLPGPEKYLAAAGRTLLPDGVVCVFCPSITQIGATLKTVREERLPLVLEKTLEFPAGSGKGAGLRAWDVRFARVRARVQEKLTMRQAENREDVGEENRAVDGAEESQFEMVCRPQAGERVTGGGFFALYRKKGPMELGSGEEVKEAGVEAAAEGEATPEAEM